MSDSLILNFLRLVRNGRNPASGCEAFTFGDLRMLDNGSYEADEKGLQKLWAMKGRAAEVALVVYIKGTVAEVWRFQDYRATSEQSFSTRLPSAIGGFQGLFLTEQQEASLKMLVRVIFAYLRIHEIFVDVMNANFGDTMIPLVIDTDLLPQLEKDTSVEHVWAVEGLISIKSTYNRLWRASICPAKPQTKANSLPTRKATNEDAYNERRVGSVVCHGSDSLGSTRSVPTPRFAPAPLPGFIGSGHASQLWLKSPPVGPSDLFLPSTSPAAVDGSSYSFFLPSSQMAIAAAVAVHGTRTQHVRGFSFSHLPTFSAPVYDLLFEGEGAQEDSLEDRLHELLDACDNAAIQEDFVSIYDVLDKLEKVPLDQ